MYIKCSHSAVSAVSAHRAPLVQPPTLSPRSHSVAGPTDARLRFSPAFVMHMHFPSLPASAGRSNFPYDRRARVACWLFFFFCFGPLTTLPTDPQTPHPQFRSSTTNPFHRGPLFYSPLDYDTTCVHCIPATPPPRPPVHPDCTRLCILVIIPLVSRCAHTHVYRDSRTGEIIIPLCHNCTRKGHAV